ncbi:MAG: hypothetical protein A3B44_00565 [Candidatus Levybacteria bacterium RIFCSPLOWO2_01_FULL_38_21]|nr:MAG: hypothetical protein A3B44_00565 [Candidatus Levybacteria bacterium RIFCSPLOWO2_01_FULL_38_21]
MKVTGIKTHKITQKDKDIFRILDRYVKKLSEKSVVAIASKIVAITEGRIIKIGTIDKDELIKRESQYYLPRSQNPYNVSLTITGGALVASAGIDESNGNGYYILWPKNPQKSANRIRKWLKSRFNLENVGVIITDSRTTPLRWGVTGFSVAYSGFEPLKNYIGTKDIFGRKLEFTKLSVVDNLAAAAVMVMGEGNEQTPIVVIERIPGIVFQKKSPTKKDLGKIKIILKEDLYAPFLKNARFKKGGY